MSKNLLKNKFFWLTVFAAFFVVSAWGLNKSSLVLAGDSTDVERISPFSLRDLWLLRQARSIVETYQVDAADKKASEEKVVHSAIKGMIKAWDDPYTRFIDQEQLGNEKIEMEGQYGGLGMYIGDRDGRVLVISPMDGTPADRAGIKPKDHIVKIEDEVVVGLDSQEIVKRLRGKPNTSVTIWIRRGSEDELLKFDLEREIIKIDSVKSNMLSDDIGYLRLNQFKLKTDKETETALKELLAQGAKSLVLDLRNNGGGLLDVCVNIASLFVEEGKIVETKGRVRDANQIYNAKNARNTFKTAIPMVVLINEGSASASEILAGALADNNRAITIGKKSFGKGSVQALFNLTDGSAIYVTIARYFTPSGEMIDKIGLSPKIEVEGELMKVQSEDVQLQRAIQELKAQK